MGSSMEGPAMLDLVLLLRDAKKFKRFAKLAPALDVGFFAKIAAKEPHVILVARFLRPGYGELAVSGQDCRSNSIYTQLVFRLSCPRTASTF
jgi:hypothetical protein